MAALDGAIIKVVQDGRFTVAVTPWVDGVPLGHHAFTSTSDREAVLRLLGRLHRLQPAKVSAVPPLVDLALPDRGHLERALDSLQTAWTSGPFGERARARLAADAERVRMALDQYDELVARVRGDRAIPWVVTHGEPHQANVLRDRDGALHLVDWDTTRVAPRERDLWMVLEGGMDLASYEKEAGNTPRSDHALRLFRMRWDLGEVGTYIAQFHAPHEDDPNTRESWTNLNAYLPVADEHLRPVTG